MLLSHLTPQPRFKHDLRKLVDCLLDRAKKWWIVSSVSRIVSIIAGAMSVLLFPGFKPAAVIIFLVYIVSDVAAWRSDQFKGFAQSVLRKLDFRNSFGWPISGEEMSDLIVDCPTRLRRRIPPPSDDGYFASNEAVGTARALDNLQEASWWSKHLARRMGHITLGITIGLILASFIVHLISINSVRDFDTLTSIGRVVTSALMLVLSLGLIRLTVGYYNFAKKAEQAERDAIRLLKSNPDELDAVKAWQEYHVSRAAAPLIPSVLWRRMNKDLNEAWSVYRTRSGES